MTAVAEILAVEDCRPAHLVRYGLVHAARGARGHGGSDFGFEFPYCFLVEGRSYKPVEISLIRVGLNEGL